MDIDVNPEFERTRELLEDGAPFVFLTGRAGTGKSTFIKYIKSEFKFKKNMAVLAPTGLAALNVGGQTIHSFFTFPAVPPDRATLKKSRYKKVIENLDLLIIDEVSMVRADLLDLVDAALRLNRVSDEPFGGVQILVVGDLFQLSPVIASNEERQLIERKYESEFFFSADCLNEVDVEVVELKDVYRQSDEEFINLLELVREGEGCEDALTTINNECLGRKLDGDAVILTTTNAIADRINHSKLSAIDEEPQLLKGSFTGTFDNRSDRLPAPEELYLKRGAQVMFTKNDNDKRWMNGTLGNVVSIASDSIIVETTKGKLCEVSQSVWETYSYHYDESKDRIIPEVVGTYTQFPLKTAWAATIHKCQGMTLDNAIIDLGSRAFATGQVYVALSRCRALSGISLCRPLRVNDILVNPHVREYYRRSRRSVSGRQAVG